MRLYRGFLVEPGTVIDTRLNIARTGPGLWIRRTKAITRAEMADRAWPVDRDLAIYRRNRGFVGCGGNHRAH